MKKNNLSVILIFLLISVVLAFVSCSQEPDSGSGSDSDTDSVIVVDGEITKNLSDLKAGSELIFKLKSGKNSTLNFNGVTIDALYVVEKQSATKASKGAGSGAENSDLSSHAGKDSGVVAIIPQEDGKVSFSGSDVGVTENEETLKITRLGNIAELKTNGNGDNYFQFKMENTEKDYENEGYPRSEMPSYQNYYTIDLNDEAWAKYKDEKVVVFQAFKSYYIGSGGSKTSDFFGLVDVGKITYGEDRSIQGLYDLKGKDKLYLYSFLRTPFVKHNDLRFETYVLLPNYLDKGTKLEIKDLPLALVFKTKSANKAAYVIELRNVPKTERGNGVFGDLVGGLFSGIKYRIDEYNGFSLNAPSYIQTITMHEDKFDADVLVNEVDVDFLVKLKNAQAYNFESYGTISFRDASTEDMNLLNQHTIDLETESSKGAQEVAMTRGGSWTINWTLPENSEKTYRLTVKASPAIAVCRTQGKTGGTGGGGGDTIDAEYLISDNSYCSTGSYTLYAPYQDVTVTWQVAVVE